MQESNNASRLQSLQRSHPSRSDFNSLLEDGLQILRQGHQSVEGHHVDHRERGRQLVHLASGSLPRLSMFDKNENREVTVNETTENEYSFLLVHWSSVVVYSTIIAIVIFLVVVWRISKARWLRRFLARKCGCEETSDNDIIVERQPVERQHVVPQNSVAERGQQGAAASKATDTTLNSRWATTNEEELRNIRELKRWVEEEASAFNKPMI